MASINRRPNGWWQARYHADRKQQAKDFQRKVDAGWLDGQSANLVAGTHVTPRQARTTVGE